MTSYFGGNIKDHPNAKRKFGKGRKAIRTVQVSIHRYYGIGQHYWVSLDEETNPIWDKKEKGWRQCWDDDKGKGQFMSFQAPSIASAKQWVRDNLKKHFPKHKVKEGHIGLDSEYEDGLWGTEWK